MLNLRPMAERAVPSHRLFVSKSKVKVSESRVRRSQPTSYRGDVVNGECWHVDALLTDMVARVPPFFIPAMRPALMFEQAAVQLRAIDPQ